MAVSKGELQRQHWCTALGSAEQVWLGEVNAMPVTGVKTFNKPRYSVCSPVYCGHDLFLDTHRFQRILFQRQRQTQLSRMEYTTNS